MFDKSYLGSTNPFTSPFVGSSDVNSLDEAYKKLEFLRQQNTNQQGSARTVFSDIQKEWTDSSEDERVFIENSKEYQEANGKYQESFSLFLIDKFGNEFSNSQYGRSAEDVLAIIRNKKEKYKDKFASDIEEIKQINNKLEENNNSLIKQNESLQQQLLEIKSKLGGLNG
jgi:hypothetical protein